MHGFGSGLGFFFNSYPHLHQTFGKVYAVDWLGMGGSSRPVIDTSITSDYDKTIDYFIDSLEQFRIKNQIDKMILAGHSLGGFLYCIYH